MGAEQPDPSLELDRLPADDLDPWEWRGQYSRQESKAALLVDSAAQWEELWKKAFDRAAPPVNFDSHFAVAAFAGTQKTGGYAAEILGLTLDSRGIVIPFRVRSPPQSGFLLQSLTQPYHIRLYRRTRLKVRVAERE